MPINAICQCGKQFEVRDQLAGKEIECLSCGKKVRVPGILAGVGPAAAGASRSLLWCVTASSVALAIALGVTTYLANQRLAALEKQSKLILGDAEVQADKTATLDTELSTAQKGLATVQDELKTATDQQAADGKTLNGLQSQASRLLETISTLQSKLGTKADQAELDAVKGELEAANDDLAAIETTITKLELGLVTSEAKIAALSADSKKYDQNIKDLTQLKTSLAANPTVSPVQLAAAINGLQANLVSSQIAPLKTSLAQLNMAVSNLQPAFQIVVGERQSSSTPELWFAMRVNTSTGAATCWKDTGFVQGPTRIRPPNVIGINMANLRGAKNTVGRFEVKATFRENGDVKDVILVDTQSGVLCHCNPFVSSPFWTPIPNSQLAMSAPFSNNRFRIDVDSSNAARNPAPANQPVVVLIDSLTGRAYSDDMFFRSTMAPLP